MDKENSNSWILCPSKSYPGKLYYFNVITGEAAWCLTEEEKKELAKVAIKRVSNKSHSFPEPNTPPTEDGPNTSNICYNLNPQTNLPTGYQIGPPQIIGQPGFSKYIPNQYPGYVIPMFLASNPEPKKRSFDKITQTSDVQVPCIQDYTIPLSKRFGSYRQLNSGTKTFENKDIYESTQIKGDTLASNKGCWCNTDSSELNINTFNSSAFGSKLNHNKIKIRTSEHNPFYSNVNTSNKTNNTRIIMDPILTSINKKENSNVANFIIDTGNKATDAIKKPTLILKMETKMKNQQVAEDSHMSKDIKPSFIKAVHNSKNSSVNKHNWTQNTMFENILKQPIQKLTNSDAMVSSLNSNDLRFVLQAKRRKQKLGDVYTQVKTKDIFSSTIYLNDDLNKLNVKSKQVTFDLGLRQIEKEVETQMPEKCKVHTPDSVNVTKTDSPTPQVINTSYLKSLAKTVKKTDLWYVVVDIGVLLNDFEFIEDFVIKDTTCRLLIPNSVRSYIETMSVGEYGGRTWVMLARKAMRRLASIEKHIRLQSPVMETSSSSAIDRTIECCFQALQSNHAVLITTDTELYNKGISSGINTFKLDDVKKSIKNEPKVSFNMNISIEIENDNICKQNTDNFEPFPLRKFNTGKPVNESDIFKVPATVKNSRKCIGKYKVDSSKPLAFEKSNVVTDTTNSKKIKLIRKRAKDNVTCNKQIGSNMGDDIKLLNLHDNRPENSKLSESLLRDSRTNGEMNIRKVIINTNTQNNDFKDEKNLKTGDAEHRQDILDKPDINLPNDLRYKPPKASSTSEFGIKIKPLIVSVPGKQQSTNSLRKGGPRLKVNAYTLEDLLKRFHVKDSSMDQRIESRLDEWVCCFSQIMEDCLSDILMNNTQEIPNKLSAPWTLLEAVLCLKEVYANNTAIKTIADKLCSTMSNLSDKNDNLKSKMKSADFMRLFGCGALLVESLKIELPQSVQVLESEKLLNKLLHHIQDPSTDIDLPFTPMRIVRSEIDDMESVNRNIVPKKPAEIIGYLKIHFPAWKDFDGKALGDTNTQEIDLQNERTVVRTLGNKLNTIRINNAKKITFDNIPDHETHEFQENFATSVHKDLPKIKRTIDNIPKDVENYTKPKCDNDLNKIPHKISTKRIINSKETITSDWKDSVIDDDNVELGLENYNFAEDVMIDEDVNAMPFNDDKMKTYDAIHIDDEISLFEKGNGEIKGDDRKNCYDSTNDSGHGNQSLDACAFIKLFLTELSASFKLTYTFIEDSIQEFRSNVVELKDKKVLYDKANETHLYLSDIIGKLKRIIDREVNENTKLKSLIINAGIEALNDKRITRYRQVIMKCLEQAQLLEGALKTMLALTNEHCDITTIDIDNVACQVPYLNIFE